MVAARIVSTRFPNDTTAKKYQFAKGNKPLLHHKGDPLLSDDVTTDRANVEIRVRQRGQYQSLEGLEVSLVGRSYQMSLAVLVVFSLYFHKELNMTKLFGKLRNGALDFARDEEGAQIVEYALIIAVVSIALIVALKALTNNGGGFSTFITHVTNCLSGTSCP